jgi:hypothetical protein
MPTDDDNEMRSKMAALRHMGTTPFTLNRFCAPQSQAAVCSDLRCARQDLEVSLWKADKTNFPNFEIGRSVFSGRFSRHESGL